LDEQDREQWALLFVCAPDLKRAYDLREELTGIFEVDHTKEWGTTAVIHRLVF